MEEDPEARGWREGHRDRGYFLEEDSEAQGRREGHRDRGCFMEEDPEARDRREGHRDRGCFLEEDPEANVWVGTGEECFREAPFFFCFFTCLNLNEHFPTC